MSRIGLSLGAIEFGSQQWVLPVVGVVAFAVVLLLFSYRSVVHSTGFKSLLIALKAIGIALVGLCLLNPTLVKNQIRPGENIIVLLADNSVSMQIQDQDEAKRSDRLVELIQQDEAEWLTRLTQDFDLRRYAFDERINPFEDFAALDFSGRRSQLAGAIDSLQQRFRNQPLGGVLLLTDGNASDWKTLEQLELTVPIYPVLTESSSQPRFDVSIDQVVITESSFEDAPITISAMLTSTAETETAVVVTLQPETELDGEGRLQQALVIPVDKPRGVSFQLKPEELGVGFYRLSVFPEKESDLLDGIGQSSEATLANNHRLLAIDRGSAKYRILYVGGRPNWEFKFFNRAVGEDRLVDLVSLIRIAKKEAKFDFRGRVGETSNPLFRGQDREADAETEAFDQAVLIRLNTRDALELSDGFPKSKKDLYQYDAVILDDIEAGFFTADQQSLLDRFVAERGGGVLMLGGRDSFQHGQWHKTPLRDVLPVYLDREEAVTTGLMHWRLTREGWLEPWMRTRSTEIEEKQRLSETPGVEILSRVRETKPGARVFAEILDVNGRRFPAVVAQQYGRGRAVTVLVGDLWKWSLKRGEGQPDDLAQNWRQMVRWLVADVPQKLEIELEWTQLGSVPAVQLKVRIRDEEFQSRQNAVVSVAISLPSQKLIELTAEPSLSEPGLFETTYVPREEGAYLAEISVQDEGELPPQTMSIGWTSQPDEEEFRQINVNRAALADLAERSQGKLILVNELPEFVRMLPDQKMPMTEIKTTPLWHSPLILLLALTCFASEWGLRRWRGLP